MDLDTGAELWVTNIPFNPNDWTTWVAGVKDGRVFASRSGNGASVSAKMYALDAATGLTLWISQDTTDAGAYDGVRVRAGRQGSHHLRLERGAGLAHFSGPQ
jgi:outer membrane protein assembly factor BamB